MLEYLLLLLETDEDKELCTYIVTQYERRVYAVCMGILHDHPRTEDVMMETWVKLLKNFEDTKEKYYSTKPIFEPWLVTVAKNTARDALRKKKRDPEPIEMWDMPSAENIEEKVEVEDRLENLKRMVQGMADQYRSVLECGCLKSVVLRTLGSR